MKGTCPQCGGELRAVKKTQYACRGCGTVFVAKSKTSLPAAIAPLALKLINEHGETVGGGKALTGNRLTELLLEHHRDTLVPLMLPATQRAELGVQIGSLRTSLDTAWRQGLLGSIPPRRRLYCATDHPKAEVHKVEAKEETK